MASGTVSRLVIAMAMDASALTQGAKQSEQTLIGLASRVEGLGSKLRSLFSTLVVGGFVGWGVKLAADAQTAQIAFEVMLGSASDAQKMLFELRDFAAKTPFEFPELQAAARTMLAFGVAGKDVIPSIKMLGDVAGGDGEKLRLLALAFSQVAAAGRLTGQDLLQLVNAGFNPLQEISRKTGLSLSHLRDEMRAGNISFEMVKEAFESATGVGGRFHGMMERMAKALHGQWGRFKDNVGIVARNVGEALIPTLGTLLEVGIDVTNWLKGLDQTTVQNTANLITFTAAFAGSIILVPKIIAGVSAIVKAFRALGAAQAIQQALSGPAGWATLAVSIGIAAGAAYAVNGLFDQQEQKLAKVTEQIQGNTTATGEMVAVQELLAESTEDATKAMEALQKRGAAITESVRTPIEMAADRMAELDELVKSGTISSETYSRAMKEVADDLSNATDKAKELKEATRSEVGALSRNSMASFSAILQARFDQDKQADLAKKQLAEEQKQTTELREANRLAKERTVIKQATL